MNLLLILILEIKLFLSFVREEQEYGQLFSITLFTDKYIW